MSAGRDTRPPAAEGGARHYVFLCLTALLVVALALLLRGQQTWCLFPALVGGVALALRLRAGPVFFLAVLAWQLYSQWLGQSPVAVLSVLIDAALETVDPWHRPSFRLRPWAPAPPFVWVDLLLAPAVLAYVAGYYRLQSLRQCVFPPDLRHREPRPAGRTGPVVRQR
ncbi:MAG TPA: hypothetical protein VFA26_18985, partial [Gemmataceae bacterium]|nr:hypothetical protein [Gemmataceae bacterium]